MEKIKQKLIEAEEKALILFEEIQKRGLICVGKSEHTLNKEIFVLAFEIFGIKKFWHKRIVRAGKNTLCPYKENPPDLTLQEDDILFFDFGPVFENWEADIGKTYVIGNNADKLILHFYNYTKELARKYGWDYGNVHCGHLIGNFPHEILIGEELINYIHPENTTLMCAKDKNGNERFWIYEIHFVNAEKEIGGFFEQFLN